MLARLRSTLLFVSAVALAVPGSSWAQSLVVENYQLVSKTRVTKGDNKGHAKYEYVYRVDLRNSGPSVYDARGTVSSRSKKVTIVDGEASFGLVLSGQAVTSSDTIVIRAKKSFDKRHRKFLEKDERDSDSDDRDRGGEDERDGESDDDYDKKNPFSALSWTFDAKHDAAPPVVSDESPKDVAVPSASPDISARYVDSGSGIDPTRTRLLLDGADVTAQASLSTNDITFKPSSPLSEGAHSVALTVADRIGNATTSTWSFRVDTLPPAIGIQAPADGTYPPTTTPTISAQYTDVGGVDPARVRLSIDGADITSAAVVTADGISYQPATPLAGGVHSVTLVVIDFAGNSTTFAWSFFIDVAPPVISGETPRDVTVPTVTPVISARYTDSGSGVDATRTMLLVDGRDVTADATVDASGISYQVVSALGAGQHTVSLKVYDRAGNPGQSDWGFSVDTTPPVITKTVPKDAYVGGSPIVIRAEYGDGESGIDVNRTKLLLDGADVTVGAEVSPSGLRYQPALLSEGRHDVELTIYDLAGNNSHAVWQFQVDLTPPVIRGETPKDLIVPGGVVSIAAQYADIGSGIDAMSVVLLVDDEDVTSRALLGPDGLSYQADGLSEGQHRVYLLVSDQAGIVKEAAWSFAIQTPITYVLELAAPLDGSVVRSQTITVSGTVSASHTNVTSLTVSGLPASLQATPGGYVYTATLRLQEGTNVVNVLAAFGDGQMRSASASVIYDGPPQVLITTPQDLATLGPVSRTSPRDLSGAVERPVQITGKVNKEVVSVTVNQQPATLSGNDFTFEQFFLHEGVNLITVVATDSYGRTGSASITVSVDQTAPIVAIEHPAEGTVTSQSRITVRGLVNDAVEGLFADHEPAVTVNGIEARVADRYFIASGVPLDVGENMLTVTVRDQQGNQRTTTAKVIRIAAGAPRLTVISGNNQTGALSTELADPLVVMALDALGQPLVNREVTFDVLRGTGGVSAFAGGSPVRNLAVMSDSAGVARVYLTTGKQSGFGMNVVRASAPAVPEDALLFATGQAGRAARIHADMMGVNQYAEAGAKTLEPLVAIVTDAAHNRIGNVPVIFKIEQGDASFDGQPQITVMTDKNGLAVARPIMGIQPGKVHVTASVDQVGATAFTIVALAPTEGPTRFSGTVLNDRHQPLPGVQVSIGRTALAVTTDAHGRFSFDANVPPGRIDLFVDGRTAVVQNEVYPALHFEALAVRGQENKLPLPIFLPPLNTPETKIVGGDEDVVLRIPGMAGFSMKVFARSVTFPDGSKTGPLVVSRVNQDKLPMVPPGGASLFMAPAWTIQPSGTRFDPPIQVTIPNSAGLQPGESVNIYQWDHDLATFVPIGRATTSEDAAYVVTDAGSGVTKAGWGGGPPPPPPNTCTTPNSNCEDCKKFDASPSVCACVSETYQVEVTAPQTDERFNITTTPAMPNITAGATITPNANVSSIWKLSITSTEANRTCTVSCSTEQRGGSWAINFGSCTKSASVVGGEAELTVKACSVSDTTNFKIRADEPGKAAIQAALGSDDTAKRIACRESRQTQFCGPGALDCASGRPTTSATGAVGAMQIISGKTCEHIWNWQANIQQGLALLAEKRAGAARHHRYEHQFNQDLALCKANNGLPNFLPLPLDANQQEREAIRRYNSGREHYWQIDDPLTCEGHWIVQPRNTDDPNYVNNVLALSPACP